MSTTTGCQSYAPVIYYAVPIPVAQEGEQIVMTAPVETAMAGQTAPMEPFSVCIADQESNSLVQVPSQVWSIAHQWPLEFDSCQWQYSCPKPALSNDWQSLDSSVSKAIVEQTTDADSAQKSWEEKDAETVASQWLQQLRAGGEEKWNVVVNFPYSASACKVKCKAAQHVLRYASALDKALLAESLHSHVRRLVKSKFGNYVIQAVVEVLPIEQSRFVVTELLGAAVEFACKEYGCRVFCRILEHFPSHDDAAHKLVSELLGKLDMLIRNPYGSFVIRHIVEFEWDEHKKLIAQSISQRVMEYANDGLGSHVVECCLKYCSSEDQALVLEALLADANSLAWLASAKFGRHVTRVMAEMAEPHGPKARTVLAEIEQWAMVTKHRRKKTRFAAL